MKKTLFIVRNFLGEGGSSKVYREIYQRLNAKNCSVLTKKTNISEESSQEFASCGVLQFNRLGIFDYDNYFTYLIDCLKLLCLLKKLQKRDGFTIFCLEKGLEIEGLLLLLFFKIKIVLYCHGEEFNQHPWIVSRFIRTFVYKYYNFSKKIFFVVVSGATKELVKKYVGKSAYQRTIINYSGVSHASIVSTEDRQNLKRKYELENKFVILTVSRFDYRKGHHLFLPMIKKLIQTIPNLVWVTIGQGKGFNEFKSMASKSGLDDRVLMLGQTSEEVKNDFYRLADIFLLLCYTNELKEQEGFGLVFLEANSFGLPVIAGNSGGVEEAVAEDVSGYLVDPFNNEEVCLKIKHLHQNPEKLDSLRKSSWQWAQNFSWDKTANTFQQFVDSIK